MCIRTFAAATALAVTATVLNAQEAILVQSTTSTEASGLYDHLLPMFAEETGVNVNVVAVGTGQAIQNARNCDGDVLLVHAKEQEERFVEDGMGVERFDLMYNDFVVVGPGSDPAGVAGMDNAQEAFATIAEVEALFASRGDESGTHAKELQLWESADVNVEEASADWYRETGSGMGPTLNTAVGMEAYALTDRATWISFENRGDFEVLVEGDADLFNQYGVILVNPEECPSVNAKAGQVFVDWLLSDAGQDAIASYELNDQQLFIPNANG